MRNPEDKKKSRWASLIAILVLAFPEFVIPAGISIGVVYLIYCFVRDRAFHVPVSKSGGTKKQASFDDCPKKLFCFHKDKGEHHLARGKEIDPWDRPDIDISKYQRKE
jgi:hypothetical protein